MEVHTRNVREMRDMVLSVRIRGRQMRERQVADKVEDHNFKFEHNELGRSMWPPSIKAIADTEVDSTISEVGGAGSCEDELRRSYAERDSVHDVPAAFMESSFDMSKQSQSCRDDLQLALSWAHDAEAGQSVCVEDEKVGVDQEGLMYSEVAAIQPAHS
ncbi:hypothetical protein F0562_025813 [Nyssa sinensis]|uniref:Uncharacterized protein n=1 Tax=Nyssa sinensis TaxID=561372 RepID=A0A5J5BD37_9ASTE|nr:hypothetical protein F0562_025813 [Nyssa sinensis]